MNLSNGGTAVIEQAIPDVQASLPRDEHDVPATDEKLLEGLGEEDRARLASKKWIGPSAFGERALMSAQAARELGVSPPVASYLESPFMKFGGEDFSQHRDYLNPHMGLIRSAEETTPGADAAARALAQVIKDGKKVAVFSDYDVDGATSARVLQIALEASGASEDQVIMEYASGGFGLTMKFVAQARAQGAEILVTLDCGSTQDRAIAQAQAAGMQVIVVDHHDISLENTADFHLNPRYQQALRYQGLEEALPEARKLFRQIEQAWVNHKADPGNPELAEALEALRADAEAMTARLDRHSQPAEPSPKLSMAIARAKSVMPKIIHGDDNTGAQLAWKLGTALQQAAGVTPDEESWNRHALYLAGMGAMADMGSMRDLENRAFVRLPVAGGSAPAPPGVEMLAEHFGEDPADPSSLKRTRAVLNLGKRTPRVKAETVVKALGAQTRQQAAPTIRKLLGEYDVCRQARAEMTEIALKDAKRRMRAHKRAHAGDGEEAQPKWVFAFITDERYAQDAGQTGLIAQKLAKEYGLPAIVGVTAGTDAHGNPKDKFSGRNNQVPAKIGDLCIWDKKVREACTLAEADEEGAIAEGPVCGGHAEVFSGSVMTEKRGELEKALNAVAEKASRSDASVWRQAKRNKVWLEGRLLSPSELERVEREVGEMITPFANDNRAVKVSVAARAAQVGALDEETNSHPAVLELADGSTRAAEIPPDMARIFKTGAFLETLLYVEGAGKPYWLSQATPIPAQPEPGKS